jgi:hypothetical protein
VIVLSNGEVPRELVPIFKAMREVALDDARTEVVALQAQHDAVPVAAIARIEKVARYLLAQTGRGAGGPAVDDCLAIQAWLATRPEVQP